jgi:hypothetical protein
MTQQPLCSGFSWRDWAGTASKNQASCEWPWLGLRPVYDSLRVNFIKSDIPLTGIWPCGCCHIVMEQAPQATMASFRPVKYLP